MKKIVLAICLFAVTLLIAVPSFALFTNEKSSNAANISPRTFYTEREAQATASADNARWGFFICSDGNAYDVTVELSRSARLFRAGQDLGEGTRFELKYEFIPFAALAKSYLLQHDGAQDVGVRIVSKKIEMAGNEIITDKLQLKSLNFADVQVTAKEGDKVSATVEAHDVSFSMADGKIELHVFKNGALVTDTSALTLRIYVPTNRTLSLLDLANTGALNAVNIKTGKLSLSAGNNLTLGIVEAEDTALKCTGAQTFVERLTLGGGKNLNVDALDGSVVVNCTAVNVLTVKTRNSASVIVNADSVKSGNLTGNIATSVTVNLRASHNSFYAEGYTMYSPNIESYPDGGLISVIYKQVINITFSRF